MFAVLPSAMAEPTASICDRARSADLLSMSQLQCAGVLSPTLLPLLCRRPHRVLCGKWIDTSSRSVCSVRRITDDDLDGEQGITQCQHQPAVCDSGLQEVG